MPGRTPAVEVFPDIGALSVAAAKRLAAIVRPAVLRRKRFVLGLAGGHTPRPLYEQLAGAEREEVQWRRVVVIFGDERCVAPTDPASNYAMAAGALLAHVPIPQRNVLRIAGELDPEDAAERYEGRLRALFPDPDAPIFDVLLLGVGADGHTASLFPGSPALLERERWVVPVQAPRGVMPRDRITLTLPVLERAREVWFLASGADKRPVIAEILGGTAAGRRLPASLVHGRERTVWWLDRQAAPER